MAAVAVDVDCKRMGNSRAADNGVLIGAAGIKPAAVVRRHIKAGFVPFGWMDVREIPRFLRCRAPRD